MKKILYMVLDGLGDRAHPQLEGRTPLEVADIPNINRLAREGQTGLVYTVGKNIAPESDIAVISILGYDAHKYYTGRGPLECFAEGVEVKDGDLAYRVNFATLGKNNEIIDRRVGRDLTTEEATSLAKEINEKVRLNEADFVFKNTVGHRGVLLIRSRTKRLSAKVSNTDPAYGKEGVFGVAKEKFDNFLQPCQPEDSSPEANLAAELTNEFIEKVRVVLEESEINKRRTKQNKLPANVVLTRDAGDQLPKFPSVREKFGLDFGCFVEMPVEKGIALLTGMEIIKVPLPSGELEKDYGLRANRVIEVIKDFDGLYIHLKGPDEPAHDGNPLRKKEIIEAIDKYFFAVILNKLDLDQTIICVTADHSTPCILKAHSQDPVPILIWADNIPKDNVGLFSEKSVKRGQIGEILGYQIMPHLVNLARG